MSNPLYINFKNIADDLQYMVEHHKQINSYGLGDTDQLSYWTQVRDQDPNDTLSPLYFLYYTLFLVDVKTIYNTRSGNSIV